MAEAGIPILVGFSPNIQTPIDTRLVVADETARLNISAYNCYNGMIVYQLSNTKLYVLINATNPAASESWTEVGAGSSGGTPFSFDELANQLSHTLFTISVPLEAETPTTVGVSIDYTAVLYVAGRPKKPVAQKTGNIKATIYHTGLNEPNTEYGDIRIKQVENNSYDTFRYVYDWDIDPTMISSENIKLYLAYESNEVQFIMTNTHSANLTDVKAWIKGTYTTTDYTFTI